MRGLPVALVGMALAACGGGGSSGGSSPPPQQPSGDVPVITPAGAAAGNPVAQPVDAGGGTVAEPSTGARVRVLASTFSSSALVTVQPVTDTLPPGLGNGIAVSTGLAPQKPLLVTMPYSATDVDDPTSLRLVAQAADGSWRALYPVGIDPATHTVTAALPAAVPLSGAKLRPSAPLTAAAAVQAQPVVLAQLCRIAPSRATVKATKTQDLVPVCWTSESTVCPDAGMVCDPGAPDSCYLDLSETCQVYSEQPLLNTKAGYLRSWLVNGAVLGNDSVGTITVKPGAGATYKAPALTPTPNPVSVVFQSVAIADPRQKVNPSAAITVTPDHYHVKVDFVGSAYPVCTFGVADLTDGFELDLAGDGSAASNYTNQTTVYGTVSPASGVGTVTLFGPFELIIAARSLEASLAAPGGGFTVTVDGLAQNNPGCTYTFGDTTVTDPGSAPPVFESPLIDFVLKPTDFGSGNTLTLPPQVLGRVTATVTITR